MNSKDEEVENLSRKIVAASHQLHRVDDLETGLDGGTRQFELRYLASDDSSKMTQFSLSDTDGDAIFRLAIEFLRNKYQAELDEAKRACFAAIDKQFRCSPVEKKNINAQ